MSLCEYQHFRIFNIWIWFVTCVISHQNSNYFCNYWIEIPNMVVERMLYIMTHSQLLEGLKCESKWKTAEEGGVGGTFSSSQHFEG
jgi:hypothetical protein